MSGIAIRVENLGKQYRIGKRERYRTLRDSLIDAMSAPFRRLRRAAKGNGEPDSIWALKDVSFEIPRGEVVGVIGSNGAGKSTLLKVLSRITEPTEGRAELHGRVGSLLEVGTGFHPELTGCENIYLNGAILGMKRAEIGRKFDEIVAFAEIEKFLDTPVKHYSSGMYVRLAFAVAAHLEPEILVVDEVLAVGDASFQKKCLGKIGDVAREGRTVLFVSHNMTAMQTLCRRAIWLVEGRVAEDGRASGVVAHYLMSTAESSMHRDWSDDDEAPGNDVVRLRSARVVSARLDHITVNDSIRIEAVCQNNSPGECLNFSLVLYNAEGICVFNSASPFGPLPSGLIHGVCTIPGSVLNDGCYRVRLMIVRDTTVILLDMLDLLAFEVYDVPRDAHWYGKWPGVVRPKLHWDIDVIPDGGTTDELLLELKTIT